MGDLVSVQAHVTLALGLAVLGCTKGGDRPQAGSSVAPSAPSTGTPSTSVPAELTLDVYENGVGVIYQYDRLLERIQQGGAGAVRERFHEADVERYVVGPAPSILVALHLTPAASARWRGAVTPLAETQPFVVSLHGKQLFSGVVYTAIGAAAIDTPVLHVTELDGNIVVTLGAFQGAAYMRTAPDPEMARRLDRPELRELFRRRGALQEEEKPPSPLGRER